MPGSATLKVDARLTADPAGIGAQAQCFEGDGYAGLWVAETSHDPFLLALLGAQTTTHVDIGTSVAIAFARSPMTLATTANDLQSLTSGRLLLGLGTQVKAHIENRFSMPWSRPAARMREYVLALRAIWQAWNDRTKLAFEGEFYRHTLMTPFFAPPPGPHGPPKVLLAGVGERMTEVAGEVADGFICHSFTTERYLREVTLPALRRGRALAGKSLVDFEICGPVFVVSGAGEQEFEAARASTKQQLAFYASTPSYRAVLELHGWGELQTELSALAKQGRWAEMGGCISDEVLDEFAVVAEPAAVGSELVRRRAAICTRASLYHTYDADPALWREIVADLRSSALR